MKKVREMLYIFIWKLWEEGEEEEGKKKKTLTKVYMWTSPGAEFDYINKDKC